MPSREEFMRQMGISCDDVQDPQDVKTKFPSKAAGSFPSSAASMSPARMEAVENTAVKKRGYHAYSDELRENSVVPMEKPVQPRAATNNSRAEFLRSLGIDNMDVPPPVTQSSRSPENRDAKLGQRASQEYYARPSANRPAAVSSHDSAEEGPGPRSFMSQPTPDITLGMRKTSSTIKAGLNDSNFGGATASMLDKELEGLSVEEIKAMGNQCFESGEYRKSIRLYTRALERDPHNHALYSNRSACYLQAAKQMGIDTRMMALRDADKVIELRPDWFKGYSRKGDALFKLERYSEAAVAYERGLALDPTNTNLMHSLGEAKNAAGGVQQSRSASWSTQPQTVENLRKAQGKSAHELMEEMRESLRKQSTECIAIGNDYRAQQLQKFREGGPTRVGSSMSGASSVYDDDDDDAPVPPRRSSNTQSISLSNVRNDETFGSQAAANYQASILEQYRRKKAAAAAKSTSTY